MITLTSFQLKWLERLVLYHINEDNNMQAKLAASQYGFRAGVSTETALHEFVRSVEHCLVRKKQGYLEQGDEQLIFACDTSRVKRIFSILTKCQLCTIIVTKYYIV